MKRGLISQENMTFLHIYAPNHSTSKYMKQKVTELQAKIEKFTIIIRDFKTPLAIIAGTSGRKKIKETEERLYQPTRPN